MLKKLSLKKGVVMIYNLLDSELHGLAEDITDIMEDGYFVIVYIGYDVRMGDTIEFIACESKEQAKQKLNALKESGYKHGGIIEKMGSIKRILGMFDFQERISNE